MHFLKTVQYSTYLIEVPPIKKEEVHNFIQYRLRSYQPRSIDEIEFDFVLVESVSPKTALVVCMDKQDLLDLRLDLPRNEHLTTFHTAALNWYSSKTRPSSGNEILVVQTQEGAYDGILFENSTVLLDSINSENLPDFIHKHEESEIYVFQQESTLFNYFKSNVKLISFTELENTEKKRTPLFPEKSSHVIPFRKFFLPALILMNLLLIFLIARTNLMSLISETELLESKNASFIQQAQKQSIIEQDILRTENKILSLNAGEPDMYTLLTNIEKICGDLLIIDSFEYRNNIIVVGGRANRALEVVEVLSSSHYFSNVTVGRITPEVGTQKERFTLRCTLKEEEKPDA